MTRILLAALLPLCIVGQPSVARPQETADRLEVHAVVEEGSPGSIEVPSRFPGATFHLQPEVLMSSRDIKSATAQLSTVTGYADVLIVFTDEGARKFASITEAHLRRRLAIVVDGVVVSAPIIREKITRGRAVIGTGSFEEADRVAKVIAPTR